MAARAFFGWELGANLGHAALIADIARALIADGIEVTVAAADLGPARIAFATLPIRLVQAPRWPLHRHQGSELGQSGYQDLLALIGFGDAAKLSAVADAWSSLIDLIRPDLIVVDHGPGLMVASHGRGIPVIAIGSGFTMPPLHTGRLPPIRADRAPLVPEGRLLEAALAALAGRQIAPPDSLAALFRSDERFVFGVPELDAYRSHRNEPLYVPPGMPAFVEPPIRPHLFVYLGEEMPYLDVLARVLGEADYMVTAYFRGDVGLIPDFLQRRGHTVHRTPPRLGEVLPTVSHVLSAGGLFTAVAALAAGRPQLVLPLHDETRLNAHMLEQMGVCRRLVPTHDPQVAAAQIRSFLLDHTLGPQSRHWAKVIADRPQPGIGEAISAIRRRLPRPS